MILKLKSSLWYFSTFASKSSTLISGMTFDNESVFKVTVVCRCEVDRPNTPNKVLNIFIKFVVDYKKHIIENYIKKDPPLKFQRGTWAGYNLQEPIDLEVRVSFLKRDTMNANSATLHHVYITPNLQKVNFVQTVKKLLSYSVRV